MDAIPHQEVEGDLHNAHALQILPSALFNLAGVEKAASWLPRQVGDLRAMLGMVGGRKVSPDKYLRLDQNGNVCPMSSPLCVPNQSPKPTRPCVLV